MTTTTLKDFHLPRYEDLPQMGLYLEQTASYINDLLAALGNVNLTSSMISNYVKQDLIFSPKKKLYSRQQVAELIFIAIAKNVLPLADLKKALELQRSSYDTKTAYDYLTAELENVLAFVFGYKEELAEIGHDHNDYKHMLRNIIMAVSYKVYLDQYFTNLN